VVKSHLPVGLTTRQIALNTNPYKASTSGPLSAPKRGSSRKSFAFASTIAAVIFAAASIVFWYALGATYADGQVSFGDPMASLETDINGVRYSSYDRFFLIDVEGFIVLHMILLVLLLLVVNLLVWFIMLLRRPPRAV